MTETIPNILQEETVPFTPSYAGFWKRAVAYILDIIFISIPVSLVFIPWMMVKITSAAPLFQQADQMGEASPEVFSAFIGIWFVGFLAQLVWLLLFWLYFAKLESGPKQATPGKRLLHIKVTDLNGRRISFSRATGRTFGKIISYAIIYVGFMLAGWTKQKQALHDLLAGTLVVNQ